MRATLVGLAALAILPVVPTPNGLLRAETKLAAADLQDSVRSKVSTEVAELRAPDPASDVPGMATLVVCSVGADTIVAAGTQGLGELSLGVRNGQCRTEPVPGGRYRVQLHQDDTLPAFDHTRVLNARGGLSRSDKRSVDVTVPDGGSATVSFVFGDRHI